MVTLSDDLECFWTLLQWTLFFAYFKFYFPTTLAYVGKNMVIELLWATVFQNGAHSSRWHQDTNFKKNLRLCLWKIILLFKSCGPDQTWSMEEFCVVSFWAVLSIETRESIWFLRPRKSIKSNWIEKIPLAAIPISHFGL